MQEKESEVVYLESIMLPLLSHPDKFEAHRSTDDRGIYIVIRVHQEDMGRVIGKQGQTAHSIRNLVRQFGGINQKMISMKIEEPIGSTRRPRNDIRDPVFPDNL